MCNSLISSSFTVTPIAYNQRTVHPAIVNLQFPTVYNHARGARQKPFKVYKLLNPVRQTAISFSLKRPPLIFHSRQVILMHI